MIITIFRSRLRPEHEAAYRETAHEMETLARTMPGFVSIKTFHHDDGERVSIVEFADWESHHAWAGHPRHREAQRLGREQFYAEFSIQVAEVSRSYGFAHEPQA